MHRRGFSTELRGRQAELTRTLAQPTLLRMCRFGTLATLVKVPVYILAGGKSSRFGGDKGRALVDGIPLLLHVQSALLPFAHRTTLVVDKSGRYKDFQLRELCDGGDHNGPLGGLCDALLDARRGWRLIASCDMLNIQPNWLQMLLEARQPGDLAVAFRGEHWQPLPALYHSDALDIAAFALHSDDRSLQTLLTKLNARAVPLPDNWQLAKDINKPQDLLQTREVAIDGKGSRHVRVQRVQGERMTHAQDALAVEEPLEIRVVFQSDGVERQQSLSVTMRTPGHDFELAAGFLLSEGIIALGQDIEKMEHCGKGPAKGNIVKVQLAKQVHVDLAKMQRHFYTTSSCGVCGKSSLEALGVTGVCQATAAFAPVPPSILHGLPLKMRNAQAVFEQTGGLHAAGLFHSDGQLLALREDVGRHNAVDKLIGSYLLKKQPIPPDGLLLLSGRASFEILQKAAVAQIAFVAAVGAPSTLAVQTAEEFGLTLIGFLRDNRFNIYTGAQRVAVQTAKE